MVGLFSHPIPPSASLSSYSDSSKGLCKCWTILMWFHEDFKMHLA